MPDGFHRRNHRDHRKGRRRPSRMGRDEPAASRPGDDADVLQRVLSLQVGQLGPLADRRMHLVQCLAAKDAYQFLGSPEGELAVVQACLYCATAPKSNAAYAAGIIAILIAVAITWFAYPRKQDELDLVAQYQREDTQSPTGVH